ncbi:MAG: segregation/condensation protein A [Candidatus Aenigmatarchaeota archaeon]
MLSDKQLIDLMISEPSWEDVIVKIVAEEQMDPWNIDIIRLADTFYNYFQQMQTLDLRVPARFILITAILLRMKSDILAPKKEKLLIPESEKEEDEMLRILAAVPPLQPPIKRIPLRNVTMNELITALRKAFEVRERRKERRRRVRRAVANAMPLEIEEDITERINKLLSQIQTALSELDNIEFSRLVKSWKRDEIVEALVPLLHLSQDGNITIEQPELFKEIFVRLRNEN